MGIKKAHVEEKTDKHTNNKTNIIFLEGVNFPFIFNFSDMIDINRIESNDIGSIMKIYGVRYLIN